MRRRPRAWDRRAPLRRAPSAAATLLCGLALLLGCSSVPGVYVVESTGTGGGGAARAAKAFDATAYVEGIWSSKVVPTARKKAVDAATLLPALRDDRAKASKQYGKQSGAGAPFSFLISGSGTVVARSKGTEVGSIQVAVPGVGDTKVHLAVGPAFVGTAVRDAVGFIQFGSFTNQIDYADAATALNAKVKATVVDDVRPNRIEGQHVTFTGAFQFLDPSSVLVTPVSLQVAP